MELDLAKEQCRYEMPPYVPVPASLIPSPRPPAEPEDDAHAVRWELVVAALVGGLAALALERWLDRG